MVLDTRFNLLQRNMPATFQHRSYVEEGILFVDGERVADYRTGVDTIHGATQRHLARKSKATQLAPLVVKPAPAVDPQIADLRKRETEVAKLRQTADAKQHIGKLEKQLADLQSRQDTPKPRKGIRLGQGGFNVFKPKGTAA